MNPLIQLKTTPSLLITVTLLCFGLLPRAQAVVPPPDGGYPNFNTAEGQNALFSLTTGAANTAVGWFSLFSNAEGSFNTATGAGALLFNTADENTAVGAAALLFNTTGFANTGVGAAALLDNTGGVSNTAVGDGALQNNTSGGQNTAIGSAALGNNSTGDFKTAVGSFALFNSTGDNTTAIGASAGNGVTSANDVIVIGTGGANVDNSCFIGNIRGRTTANADAIPVLIDSAGQLGTVSSSRRFKHKIKPMDSASEAILLLRPVTFHYKNDASSTPQYGLFAEEVAQVNPDLVVHDENGDIYTVRYDAVNAMLLNEFLKGHRKVEEQDRRIQDQEVTIAQLKKQMETLIARVEEQDARIQRASDQVGMNQAAVRVVNYTE